MLAIDFYLPYNQDTPRKELSIMLVILLFDIVQECRIKTLDPSSSSVYGSKISPRELFRALP